LAVAQSQAATVAPRQTHSHPTCRLVQQSDSTQAPTKIQSLLRCHRDWTLYLIISPRSLSAAHHQNGVTSPSPRQASPAALSSAHCQPAHDRLCHPLGPQVYLASAPGQSQASPRRHSGRPAPHRLVHQRPQPRRRLYPAHRPYHGQQKTPQLLPAAREARRGNLCYCKQSRLIESSPTNSPRCSRAATARRASS
jgi:hypothetical protein